MVSWEARLNQGQLQNVTYFEKNYDIPWVWPKIRVVANKSRTWANNISEVML